MEATASTPVTDSEQWSDGTEIRSGDEMGDPQRDGYQVLGEGENDDDEDHPDAGVLSIGRLAEENPDFAERGFGQGDVRGNGTGVDTIGERWYNSMFQLVLY